MFLRRVIVTFTVGPLVLLLIYLGGYFYFIPFFLLLLLGAWEYTKLMGHLGLKVSPVLLIPLVALLLADGQWPEWEMTIPLIVAALFLSMCYALWLYEGHRSETAPMDWLAMAAGIVLLGLIGSFFFRVRGLPEEPFAWQWTMMAMLGTWVADGGAYVAGKTMGRHKLSPRTSPNKTVEGYVGGIVFGTLITVVLGLIFVISWWWALLLGLMVSVISPAGDLGISLLKREAGVKDSGNFLPGHGGALDRIDSLMWSVAFAFFLATYL